MIILKEITKEEYNKHKDDNDYIKQGCYNEAHDILYQIDNPPDYYKYYKIVGRKCVLTLTSELFDMLQELNIINKNEK